MKKILSSLLLAIVLLCLGAQNAKADNSFATGENALTVASGGSILGVFTPTETALYSFTVTGGVNDDVEKVKVTVEEAASSYLASGTKTCLLECKANTAYYVSCYNEGATSILNATLTIAKKVDVDFMTGANDALTIASRGSISGVFAPAKTALYTFTVTGGTNDDVDKVYVTVGEAAAGAGYSYLASGVKTCLLECTAGTAYNVSCYNEGATDVLSATLTIAETTLPTLSTGDNNSVTLSDQSGSMPYSPNYTFTPTENGDYKFTITNAADGAGFVISPTSSMLGRDVVSSNSAGEAIMTDLVANHTYYLCLGSTGSKLSATFTISTTTVMDKAVYKDGTLTFYYDGTDHSADGDVYKITSYDTYSLPIWSGLSHYVTKVVFDKSFASARPTSCQYWFDSFDELTEVDGMQYLDMSEVTSTLRMFYDCEKLASINGFGSQDMSKVVYTDKMFYDCKLLTSITIPEGLKEIGEGAFFNCPLTSISIPASVQKIEKTAFYRYTNPTEAVPVTLLSVPSINAYAFSYEGPDSNTPLCALNCTYTLALDDNSYIDTNTSDNRITSFAAAPTYTRSMKNKFGTIVLPFGLTVTGSEEGYDFYTISSVKDENTLVLTKQKSDIAAGTPLLVRMSEAAKSEGKYELSLTANGTSVSTAITTPAAVSGLTITGTYATTQVAAGYIIANNAFWNVSSFGSTAAYCAPFRAYLTGTYTPAPGVKQLNIGLDEDNEDAIKAINAIAEGQAEYYDLNGRKLNDLQKGVNIVKYGNGTAKKIIVK